MNTPSNPSLLERRRAVSLPHWGDGYGGIDNGFEVTNYHDGYYLDGQFRGEEVKDVIDLFHGVLCRIVRPDHPRIREAEDSARDVGANHIGKTDTHKIIVGLQERLQKAYKELGLGSARVLLAVSGSGANSRAYRLARGYTKNGPPFYLEDCYHGNDFLGNATVGLPPWRGNYSPNIDSPVRHFPHGKGGSEELQNTLDRIDGPKPYWGKSPFMFAEDIQGIGGFVNPGEEFLTDAVRKIGEKEGVFINDEVQTGMRRGSYLSVPRWLREDPSKVTTPIMITLAKALANGEPLAAVLVPETMAKDLEANPNLYGKHWDTYDCNVRSAAIASTVYDIYHQEGLGGRTNSVREAFLEAIYPIAETRQDVIRTIRGDGLMIGIQLQTGEQVQYCLNNCVKFGVKIGVGSDTLRIAPLADTPLSIAREAGQRVAKLIDSVPKS